MTRVHDMGGRFGDDPVKVDPETAPVFEHDWHARALAVTLAAGALGMALLVGGINAWYGAWALVVLGMLTAMRFGRSRR
jgi:hypothetical protein